MSISKSVIWTSVGANVFQRLLPHAKITGVSMTTEVCTSQKQESELCLSEGNVTCMFKE